MFSIYLLLLVSVISARSAGSIGVIHMIESEEDVNVVEKDQFSHAPYIAVFNLDSLYSLYEE